MSKLDTIYIIPKNSFIINFGIDSRINNKIPIYETLNKTDVFFSLDLPSRTITNFGKMSYHFYKMIFMYYDITIDHIIDYAGLNKEFYNHLRINAPKTFEDYICGYCSLFFELNFEKILKKSNKPQIVYLEEDFYKLTIILDKQIKTIIKPKKSFFNFFKPKKYIYSLDSNILRFNFFVKRKKMNLDNINIIYE